MFRIEVSEEFSIRSFLNINDSEYVDAIINNTSAILVSNTSEVFAALTLKSFAIDEDTGTSLQIRIPRSLLSNLVTVGHLLIDYNETMVTISFYQLDEFETVEKTCSASFQKQDIWTATYEDKLKLLTSMSESSTNLQKHDLASILDLIKVGSKYKTVIDCNCGVACIPLSNTYKVYKRLSSPMNFSISAGALSNLLKISSEVFEYKNYVGLYKDGLTILCTKVRGNSNEDFTLILEEKASFKAKVDLRFIYKFFEKMKISADVIVADLEECNSHLVEGTRSFEIPIMVKDLIKADNVKECKIYIPKGLLDVLQKVLSRNIVDIYNKRTFVQLQYNDIFVIFRS